MPAVRAVRLADAAGRSGYMLTAKGRSLLPVLSSIADWGLAHIPGTEARMRPHIGR
jgi:DNA-binding HxlR family transcriptional regulator